LAKVDASAASPRAKTCLSLAFALFVLLPTPPASAFELWAGEEGEPSLSLDTTLKLSAVGSHSPNDRLLFPDEWTATGLFRARFGFNLHVNDRVNAELAYEHRASLISGSGGTGGGGALPSLAKAQYRLTQLDWKIAEDGDTFAYRHEIDRLLVAFHPDWGEVTIGRQAIGLGRGVLFSAVDIFAPFSTIEVDREWRRGIDAVRVEYRTSATGSVELLGAFGESWEDSALLLRARGYIGNIDGEVLFGKRGEDLMLAGVMSGTVRDAEVHAELAFFDTPESQPAGGLFGSDHLVVKAVIGSSYTFDVGNGLTLLGEYHYSGFGDTKAADTMKLFVNPSFQERYLRGDSQILGRHAIGAQLVYPFNDAWGGGLLVLQSPTDGSGLIAPSVNWSMSDHTSVVMSAFVPWGSSPHNGRLGSEYGATPASIFLQVSRYF
jgi:hypothetical protein